jgi:tetratricopeptide (TPR) repeat protein
MKKKPMPASTSPIELGDVQDLPVSALAYLRQAVAALNRGAWMEAERAVTLSLVFAPDHPQSHRLLGIAQLRLGRSADAVATLRAALRTRPDDAGILTPLAQAQAVTNDIVGAIETLRVLVALHESADTLYLLAGMLDRHGELDEALLLFERIVSMEPGHAEARLQWARCLFYCGRVDAAAVQFRHLLSSRQQVASAWYGLAEIKTIGFSTDELTALKTLCAKPPFAGLELATLLHALGSALEAAGDYPAAFATFTRAAQLERARFAWEGERFGRHLALVRAAFAEPVATREQTLGHEVIFIVGMPRSGSTLIEQILASHPQVEGASELPDLQVVIEAESARRRLPLADWARVATPADWRRLGEDYLVRTARWRKDKPRFTDKFPGNWAMAEAALAMLPGARIIDCRRDAVEMCWSCFKQFFAPGRVAWSCAFDDLAAYWNACRRHGDYLAARYPENFRIQHYEALLDDVQGQTRELLAFCGLEFDPACLQFHQSLRAIRTASAAQVRQPLQKRESNSERYGALLDPLRLALAKAQAESES